jgi:hypothetical protein
MSRIPFPSQRSPSLRSSRESLTPFQNPKSLRTLFPIPAFRIRFPTLAFRIRSPTLAFRIRFPIPDERDRILAAMIDAAERDGTVGPQTDQYTAALAEGRLPLARQAHLGPRRAALYYAFWQLYAPGSGSPSGATTTTTTSSGGRPERRNSLLS